VGLLIYHQGTEHWFPQEVGVLIYIVKQSPRLICCVVASLQPHNIEDFSVADGWPILPSYLHQSLIHQAVCLSNEVVLLSSHCRSSSFPCLVRTLQGVTAFIIAPIAHSNIAVSLLQDPFKPYRHPNFA